VYFGNNSPTYPPPPVTYDLTSAAFSNVSGIQGNGTNVTLLINSADTASIQSFNSYGTNCTLVTAGSTLDLSHTTVSGFGVASTNGLGTTFTVGDLGTAFQIAGGPGHDTIQTGAFTFTADQRNAIFATSSIETITDPSGTYNAPPSSPGIVGLTASNDTFVAPVSGSTVYGTAATLNAGDSLTGGPGTDVLALVGSGTFRVDQLAIFTGFEKITLDNATSQSANLTLGNQPIKVDATGYAAIFANSSANWNGSDIIDGDPSRATWVYFGNNSPTYPPPPVTYDLTSATFSNVSGVQGNGTDVTLLINSADTAGIQSFSSYGINCTLVTAGSTLDLSNTTVSGFSVASTNGLGTTFTVGDLGTAFQIAGGPGHDTIQTSAFTFTADQRNAIFATSSIETITDPSGTYNTSPPSPNTSPPSPGIGNPAGDFNGDGKADILWDNTVTGDVAIWKMNGASISDSTVVANVGANSSWVTKGVGDFNGDSKADILWDNTVTGDVGIWEMNGTSIASGAVVANASPSWVIKGVGDFNGDGKADVLWDNTLTGDVGIWEMNGTSIASGAVVPNASTNWVIKGVGDFNGDGKADILWDNTVTGDVGMWEMNGTSIASGAVVANASPNWVIKGVGDFNGDGKADILWGNTVTGDVGIWEMNGTSIAAGAVVGNPGSNWTPVGTGEYNGDGKSDILFQKTDGTPMIWSMDGTTVTATTPLTDLGPNWHAKTG
jgi:hypothetical protein